MTEYKTGKKRVYKIATVLVSRMLTLTKKKNRHKHKKREVTWAKLASVALAF